MYTEKRAEGTKSFNTGCKERNCGIVGGWGYFGFFVYLHLRRAVGGRGRNNAGGGGEFFLQQEKVKRNLGHNVIQLGEETGLGILERNLNPKNQRN